MFSDEIPRQFRAWNPPDLAGAFSLESCIASASTAATPQDGTGSNSLMVGLTDLAAALVVGAIGWACVWIMLAMQSKRDGSLCRSAPPSSSPLVASGILFVTRTIDPSVLVQRHADTVRPRYRGCIPYYAGCRNWLGKW